MIILSVIDNAKQGRYYFVDDTAKNRSGIKIADMCKKLLEVAVTSRTIYAWVEFSSQTILPGTAIIKNYDDLRLLLAEIVLGLDPVTKPTDQFVVIGEKS
jgi:hypothetical protein